MINLEDISIISINYVSFVILSFYLLQKSDFFLQYSSSKFGPTGDRCTYLKLMYFGRPNKRTRRVRVYTVRVFKVGFYGRRNRINFKEKKKTVTLAV